MKLRPPSHSLAASAAAALAMQMTMFGPGKRQMTALTVKPLAPSAIRRSK